MGWSPFHPPNDVGPLGIVYLVGCGVAFALVLIYLGERMATRTLLPVIGLAAILSLFWPVLLVPMAAKLRKDLRIGRRAKARYRHIVRLLLRRKARLRRAGDAIYRASAARLAARTAVTRRALPVTAAGQSPVTRYCPGCRKNIPITAVYCTRCGRKMQT